MKVIMKTLSYLYNVSYFVRRKERNDLHGEQFYVYHSPVPDNMNKRRNNATYLRREYHYVFHRNVKYEKLKGRKNKRNNTTYLWREHHHVYHRIFEYNESKRRIIFEENNIMLLASQQERFHAEKIITSSNTNIKTEIHMKSANFTKKLMMMIYVFIIIGDDYHDCTPFFKLYL